MKENFPFSKKSESADDELKRYVQKVYERNPAALQKKEMLSELLNSNPFDEASFKKLLEYTPEERIKYSNGHGRQFIKMEQIVGKHGILEIHHFLHSDLVKFKYKRHGER